MLVTKSDCVKLTCCPDYTGFIMVLNVERVLKEEYQNDKYQMVSCCGFGCNPHRISNSTFVGWLDGDGCKYSRAEIIGCPKQEILKRWYDTYKDEIKDQEFKAKVEAQLKLTDSELAEKLIPAEDKEGATEND